MIPTPPGMNPKSLSLNPVNLTIRFLLELAMFAALAYWGWNQHEGIARGLLGAGLPLGAAALWGVFRVPNDPGKAPVAVPGIVRLGLELALFAAAVILLADAGQPTAAAILGVVTIVHYIVSIDRIRWMLAYKGASTR